jgi:hypothetical protein
VKTLFLFLGLLFAISPAGAASPTASLHLMTYQSWGYTVDSTEQGARVREILQRAKDSGFGEVIFNFRGFMVTGKSANIKSSVAPDHQATEERLLGETVKFAQGLGLRVAFRPILLVVGPKGEFPYGEKGVTWWHGNIEPRDVDAWFEAFFRYHERYLRLASSLGVSWYSIGAEMHSMTSGRGSRAGGFRYGFPEKWVSLIGRAKAILGPQVKITYGINYTDQNVRDGGSVVLGGEMKQWHVYMTTTPANKEEKRVQEGLQQLWAALDIVGIDYYRALASGRRFPGEFEPLAALLTERTSSHASQLDTMVTELDLLTGRESRVFLQELGYRSVTNSFLSPASYEERGGEVNPLHQAAAWEAVLRGYWDPGWPWMEGLGAWQVLVDENIGARKNGFSPLGNELTERAFRARGLPTAF